MKIWSLNIVIVLIIFAFVIVQDNGNYWLDKNAIDNEAPSPLESINMPIKDAILKPDIFLLESNGKYFSNKKRSWYSSDFSELNNEWLAFYGISTPDDKVVIKPKKIKELHHFILHHKSKKSNSLWSISSLSQPKIKLIDKNGNVNPNYQKPTEFEFVNLLMTRNPQFSDANDFFSEYLKKLTNTTVYDNILRKAIENNGSAKIIAIKPSKSCDCGELNRSKDSRDIEAMADSLELKGDAIENIKKCTWSKLKSGGEVEFDLMVETIDENGNYDYQVWNGGAKNFNTTSNKVPFESIPYLTKFDSRLSKRVPSALCRKMLDKKFGYGLAWLFMCNLECIDELDTYSVDQNEFIVFKNKCIDELYGYKVSGNIQNGDDEIATYFPYDGLTTKRSTKVDSILRKRTIEPISSSNFENQLIHRLFSAWVGDSIFKIYQYSPDSSIVSHVNGHLDQKELMHGNSNVINYDRTKEVFICTLELDGILQENLYVLKYRSNSSGKLTKIIQRTNLKWSESLVTNEPGNAQELIVYDKFIRDSVNCGNVPIELFIGKVKSKEQCEIYYSKKYETSELNEGRGLFEDLLIDTELEIQLKYKILNFIIDHGKIPNSLLQLVRESACSSFVKIKQILPQIDHRDVHSLDPMTYLKADTLISELPEILLEACENPSKDFELDYLLEIGTDLYIWRGGSDLSTKTSHPWLNSKLLNKLPNPWLAWYAIANEKVSVVLDEVNSIDKNRFSLCLIPTKNHIGLFGWKEQVKQKPVEVKILSKDQICKGSRSNMSLFLEHLAKHKSSTDNSEGNYYLNNLKLDIPYKQIKVFDYFIKPANRSRSIIMETTRENKIIYSTSNNLPVEIEMMNTLRTRNFKEFNNDYKSIWKPVWRENIAFAWDADLKIECFVKDRMAIKVKDTLTVRNKIDKRKRFETRSFQKIKTKIESEINFVMHMDNSFSQSKLLSAIARSTKWDLDGIWRANPIGYFDRTDL